MFEALTDTLSEVMFVHISTKIKILYMHTEENNTKNFNMMVLYDGYLDVIYIHS